MSDRSEIGAGAVDSFAWRTPDPATVPATADSGAGSAWRTPDPEPLPLDADVFDLDGEGDDDERARSLRPVLVMILFVAALAGGVAVAQALLRSEARPVDLDSYVAGSLAVPHHSEGGAYAVVLPERPRLESRALIDGRLSLFEMSAATGSRMGGVTVSYVDAVDRSPGRRIADMLRRRARAVAEHRGGDVVRTRAAAVGKQRALEFEVRGDGFVVNARAFVVGRRLYTLEVSSPEGNRAALRRLARSFKLKGRAGTP